MSNRSTDKPKHQTPVVNAPSVRVSPELSGPLSEFAEKCDLPVAHVVRVGLGYLLPKLNSGELEIVNGELRETSKAA